MLGAQEGLTPRTQMNRAFIPPCVWGLVLGGLCPKPVLCRAVGAGENDPEFVRKDAPLALPEWGCPRRVGFISSVTFC